MPDPVEPVVVRPAEPRDAFAVAALHLQAEREAGAQVPPGFLDALADAWLRDRSRRTWLAEDARHNPLGAVHGTVVRTLPGPGHAGTACLDLGFVFVRTDSFFSTPNQRPYRGNLCDDHLGCGGHQAVG